MVARKKLDAQLELLQALRDDPDTELARGELQRGLQSRSSALVTVAANIVANAELRGFEPVLLEAFERFMQQPEQSDKGCLAKSAIARALYRTEADCEALFLRGIRHVQLEPVWGGRQDTAVELRATAGLALVQNDYPQVMLELSRLLADPETLARVGAAQALGATRHVDAAVPLLRFKALAGDADPRVIGACLSSLLSAEPASSLAFVAELLSSPDEQRREAAAIALGESHLEGALGPLREACERALLASDRRAAMLGLSLLRSDAAWSYLLGLVRDAPDAHARQALEALAVFRHDQELCKRALQAVAGRERGLEAFAREKLGA
jgi:HEAT repeat protein